ncbi:glutamine synthetase family protein [Aestuariivirga litoralis]|uniref:glutamine synthetase family protein n=1 Tax=Aestuariivirga litoralis TaxID=2650924 RepID=UPI0018C45A14|nr:glutamine synthetase family protein [Aestuariivirga litoralis]MBG1231986.1 glutamine synthetase [Aestuariivirga litoralis]
MNQAKFEDYLESKKISEVECLVADMSGTARGKILPPKKFLKGNKSKGLRVPEEVFTLTINGRFVSDTEAVSDSAIDIYMQPDVDTIRIVPWYTEPTAQVICDAFHLNDDPVTISPRSVLRRVLELYKDKGWRPVIAPELEFYLVKKNIDPDYPLDAAVGRSGRKESGGQAYGIDAANDFDPIVEDIYDWCEAQELDVDTLSHEAGPAQLEINFNHGDPLELADQVFLFKRTVRQAALKHDVYATFMAKPHENEPGSSMHIHQSVVDAKTGRSIFAGKDGKPSKLFLNHIGGMQRYMAATLPLLAPNVNSYRRLVPESDAPTNVHWAIDNRTVSLRVPSSDPANLRVENRVAGADANPYLAFAASLAAGYLGMVEKVKPSDPVTGSAYRYAHTLPISLDEALDKLSYTKTLRQTLGEQFCEAYIDVKFSEMQHFRRTISSWEREFLLLNV